MPKSASVSDVLLIDSGKLEASQLQHVDNMLRSSIGVGDGTRGQVGRHVPPKIRENIFRAIIM